MIEWISFWLIEFRCTELIWTKKLNVIVTMLRFREKIARRREKKLEGTTRNDVRESSNEGKERRRSTSVKTKRKLAKRSPSLVER